MSSDVVEVYANRGVFAALKSDGSVIVWGTGSGSDASSVSSDLTSGVVKIFTSEYAFAALKSDGSVVTWGGMDDGTGNAGDSSSVSSELTSDVVHIYSSKKAFAAFENRWIGCNMGWGAPWWR